MTLEVVFLRAARAEFDSAALRYDLQRAGLGMQFISEINRVIDLASTHPERFPVKYLEIRRARARRFPYSVYFRSEATRIVVLSVFHARRNPTRWRERA
jgi:plasmid stabilization system protein ParE